MAEARARRARATGLADRVDLAVRIGRTARGIAMAAVRIPAGFPAACVAADRVRSPPAAGGDGRGSPAGGAAAGR